MVEYDLELIIDEDPEDPIEFEIPFLSPDDDIDFLTEEELLLLFDTPQSL